MSASAVARPQPAAVLAKALVRASRELELSQGEVAAILGSSAASVSRTFAGSRGLDPASAAPLSCGQTRLCWTR